MSDQQQIGIFIAATTILWIGYVIGYRVRMYENKGSCPAWVGLAFLACMITAVAALFLIGLLILNACGIVSL